MANGRGLQARAIRREGLITVLVGKRPLVLFISTLGAASALAALVACGPAPLTKQQMQGLVLYKQRCAHCHEDNDLALKKAPPDLRGLFRHDKLPSGAPATDAEVQRVVIAGKGLMPSFAGRFTNDQISALLAYLHTGLR